jgi:hypothetical protein
MAGGCPVLINANGLGGEPRNQALGNDREKDDDEVKREKAEIALLNEKEIASDRILFIQDEGHVESRNDIEALHRRIAMHDSQPKDRFSGGVGAQNRQSEEKPEYSHVKRRWVDGGVNQEGGS